ncbi:MAG: AMP-binding protein [Clostridia bacterium]|nr:AMP-binding protein [Clostridia bacterium]
MRNNTIGGFPNIDAFVTSKQERFSASRKDFGALFGFMFSEEENIMFEASEGYRIVKTTYGECRRNIERRAAKLASRLSAEGADSAIGIYLPNSREWIEVFWAVLMCGFRPLLLNGRLDAGSLSRAIADLNVRAVIAPDSGAPDFPAPIVTLSDIAPGSETFAPGEFGSEILVMSSGTSDRVKVCAYTAEEFSYMIADSCRIIRDCPAIKKHYKGQLKLLTFLPFCHIFGLVAVYIWFAFFSRTFVLLSDMDPDTIMNTIRRHEVTHIFAVPMFWNTVRREALKTIRSRGEATYARFEKGMRIMRKLAAVPVLGSAFRRLAFREVRGGMFGESICFLISGGSEISPAVLEFFNGIGYRLANGYGMTEIGITSVELSGRFSLLASGSVGLPFRSVEYRIDPEGQLLVRGRSTARRIFEGGTETERGEWFATGDLAEYKNNRYYILGRKDDIIISPTGENLNPCLVEDRLGADGVRECCLVGLPNEEKGGDEPVLIASLKAPVNAETAGKAYDALRKSLAENGLRDRVTRIVLVRESLLSGSDFKLNRGRIAKRFMEGGFTVIDGNDLPACGEGADAELLAHIRGLFAKALGKDVSEIGENSDFFLDEGGTSLDFFGVVSELQREYDITFPADSGQSLSRADEIARFIEKAADGKLP